jgi:hypothetical protein
MQLADTEPLHSGLDQQAIECETVLVGERGKSSDGGY